MLFLPGWVDCVFRRFYGTPPTPRQCTMNSNFLIFHPFHCVIFPWWKKKWFGDIIHVALSVCVSLGMPHRKCATNIWLQKSVKCEELAQLWRNRSLDVQKSVWKLWVCCIVWLCVFTADEEYEDGIERTCDTLLMCIVTVLNQGLRNGGGVGDVLRRPSKDVSWRKIVFHGAHDHFF